MQLSVSIMNKGFKMGISVLTSSEYNLDLHISQKRKDYYVFLHMKKVELSFICENNGSLMNKRE